MTFDTEHLHHTATALDISPGTVKSRLSRALSRLASDLEVSDAG